MGKHTNFTTSAVSNRWVALGGTFGINLSNYSKKQIRTNFDLRNSSDLLRLVTRTGIGRLARNARWSSADLTTI